MRRSPRPGGWSGQLLLEDLDISLRAFARGWTWINLVTLAAAGELPESPAALVAQRRRWALGTGQSSRALSWRLLRRMRPDRAVVFCLLSLQHAALAILLLAAGLSLLIDHDGQALTAFAVTLALVVVLKSAGAGAAQWALGHALSIVDLAAMWIVEAMLLPTRVRALVQGLLGRQSEPFVRTPKKR